MNISDLIEKFIVNIISESQNCAEIQRNELALRFNCVPSQINYVISTRFTEERGYVIESRRGGGGYIKIRRIDICESNYLMHILNIIGEGLSYQTLLSFVQNFVDYGHITAREASLIVHALSDNAIDAMQPNRDCLRAKIFKNMILGLIE